MFLREHWLMTIYVSHLYCILAALWGEKGYVEGILSMQEAIKHSSSNQAFNAVKTEAFVSRIRAVLSPLYWRAADAFECYRVSYHGATPPSQCQARRCWGTVVLWRIRLISIDNFRHSDLGVRWQLRNHFKCGIVIERSLRVHFGRVLALIWVPERSYQKYNCSTECISRVRSMSRHCLKWNKKSSLSLVWQFSFFSFFIMMVGKDIAGTAWESKP